METLLQQTDSLSNSQRFNVNFVGQNLQQKTKGNKVRIQFGQDHQRLVQVSFMCSCFYTGTVLQRYLVGEDADVLLDVSGAFDDFREGKRRHCDAGKNGTSHFSVAVIVQNQHIG